MQVHCKPPMNLVKNLQGRFSPVGLMMALAISISFLTRLLLLLANTGAGINLPQAFSLFGIGLLYDVSVAGAVVLLLLIQLWFQNNFIYRKKVRPFAIAAFIILIGLLVFTNIIPKDYNRQVFNGLVLYIVLRFIIYTALAFLPYRFRIAWRRGMLYFFFTLMTFLLLLNAVSEWFFWQEFSVRYNFIAVDYLIYTNEVIGNIVESYHIYLILTGIGIAAVLITFLLNKKLSRSVVAPTSFVVRSGQAAIVLAIAALTIFIPDQWRQFSNNEYANELAGNGLFQFGVAFNQNELNFNQFYQTLPDAEAFTILRKELQAPYASFVDSNIYNIERQIAYPQPEQKRNVVLISIESYSADFMKAFGNTQNLTPYLDSLAKQSLFFTQCYAAGTRTVRGLEALSLSIPPTPGQSTVKRPDNGGLFSLGSVFKSKGYTTQYLYGGDSYFDNMKAFFGNNGYEVIDRFAIPPKDIHYENIWGVADEDLFTLAIETLDKNAAQQMPFFTHIMTVSNHRPFTYPDGRIDIPSASQSREGGVKYTDYAINRFLKEASTKPWFANTIFVIVADHCASSAGKTELPVTGYHIPMMIYAPKLVQPQVFSGLISQIDVAPTVLGLLHFQYNSKFFGQDVLNISPENQRAFISTYQGLGYLQNGKLVIQEPVRKLSEYVPDFATGNATTTPLTDSLAKKAMAYYQCASWLLQHKKYTAK